MGSQAGLECCFQTAERLCSASRATPGRSTPGPPSTAPGPRHRRTGRPEPKVRDTRLVPGAQGVRHDALPLGTRTTRGYHPRRAHRLGDDPGGSRASHRPRTGERPAQGAASPGLGHGPHRHQPVSQGDSRDRRLRCVLRRHRAEHRGDRRPLPQGAVGVSSTGIGFLASATFGSMYVGAALAGWLSDLKGRKTMFNFNLALYSLGALVCALAPNFEVLVTGRVIVGLGLGGEFVVGLTLLAEMTSTQFRGTAISLLQVGAGGLGNPAAYLFGWVTVGMVGPHLPQFLGGPDTGWRWVFVLLCLAGPARPLHAPPYAGDPAIPRVQGAYGGRQPVAQRPRVRPDEPARPGGDRLPARRPAADRGEGSLDRDPQRPARAQLGRARLLHRRALRRPVRAADLLADDPRGPGLPGRHQPRLHHDHLHRRRHRNPLRDVPEHQVPP